jgi:nucleotide-binding universal stress UspA family protein
MIARKGGAMAASVRWRRKGKAAKWTGYHRILWPTDFSPLAKVALPHAVALAAAGADLVLLHVLPSLAAYAVPERTGALSVSLQRKARAAAQRQLHRLETQVKGPHFWRHTVLTEGVPFDQILSAAKRLRCDLIVLATHGRTGLAHAIMGSVAENAVRRGSSVASRAAPALPACPCAERFSEEWPDLAQWLTHGTLKCREDSAPGIDNAP